MSLKTCLSVKWPIEEETGSDDTGGDLDVITLGILRVGAEVGVGVESEGVASTSKPSANCKIISLNCFLE